MKTLIAPKPRRSQPATKWIPGGIGDAAITKAEAEQFTTGLTRIAAQITGLPADFATNHDQYIHELPKK
jgi:hypothetical protein